MLDTRQPTTSRTIPFHRPHIVGREQHYISEALADRRLAGDGPFAKRCEALLTRELAPAHVLLTTSCTHALEMAALLLELRAGDEVILPSFTFTSTANAFVLRGARPVFADIRPDTLNLDETRLEALITPRTRAVVPVHYGGVGCEMDAIGEIAARHGITVVEDNAHGLFGAYRDRPLGTFGALATQSFHDTKNITCGEGGALVVNQARFLERAEVLREKGTNRARFFRGEVDKYTWTDVGSSFVPGELVAAFLLAQLEARDEIQRTRRRLWQAYYDRLLPVADELGLRLPMVPSYCEQTYHLFHVLLPSLEIRQALMAHLKARGIASAFHYQPLHLSTMGLTLGGKLGDCPVTEDVADRLLRLPLHCELDEGDVERVVDEVVSFMRGNGRRQT